MSSNFLRSATNFKTLRRVNGFVANHPQRAYTGGQHGTQSFVSEPPRLPAVRRRPDRPGVALRLRGPAAQVQQLAKVPRIGVLCPTCDAQTSPARLPSAG